MCKINWREWRAAFWDQKMLTLPGLIFVLAVQISALVDWSRRDYIPALMNKVADTREIEGLAKSVQEAGGPYLLTSTWA
jgi:hypothetical protein